LLVNNLIYRQPQQVSKSVVRTCQRQRFQRREYDSEEVGRCVWNSGSDYVNCDNSYLTFSLIPEGNGSIVNFGSGSVLNIIDRIIITSRSGTELDRIERFNLWSKNCIRWEYSQDWIEKYGTMLGLGPKGSREEDDPALFFGPNQDNRFCIPLKLLSGFFNPLNKQMMPANLASGLQIEILFANHRTALVRRGDTTNEISGYKVRDIQFVLDCTSLSDDVQKTLNMESASSGLEYTFPRVYTSTNSIQSTSVNAQVRKAVSQCTKVCSTLISQNDILDLDKDSLKSVVWDVSSWQYRLGGLYFPQESLKDEPGVESYLQAQNTNDKSATEYKENAISLGQFKLGGYGVMSQSMERDQSLNLSGMPINNSRVLELTATLGSYTNPLELVTFTEYIAVARAYIDNCLLSL
jgi:hypothetical protein